MRIAIQVLIEAGAGQAPRTKTLDAIEREASAPRCQTWACSGGSPTRSWASCAVVVRRKEAAQFIDRVAGRMRCRLPRGQGLQDGRPPHRLRRGTPGQPAVLIGLRPLRDAGTPPTLAQLACRAAVRAGASAVAVAAKPPCRDDVLTAAASAVATLADLIPTVP